MARSISDEKHYFIVFDPLYNENQHCNSEHCNYTFSHTAEWCGGTQSRFCSCPYCYSEGVADRINAEMLEEVSRIIANDFYGG